MEFKMTEKNYSENDVYLRERIINLMNNLYSYDESEKNSLMEYLSQMCKLIMDLGAGLNGSLKDLCQYDKPLKNTLLEFWIDSIDVEKLDFNFLVAFLRYTGTYRNEVKNWRKLRDDIYLKLKESNKNADHVLRGLMN
jgi:hypothetical protein